MTYLTIITTEGLGGIVQIVSATRGATGCKPRSMQGLENLGGL